MDQLPSADDPMMAKNHLKRTSSSTFTKSSPKNKKPSKTPKNKRIFKCDHCGKCLSSTHYLMLHIRTHTGESPHECQECKCKFKTPTYLKQHMVTHAKDKKPFKCEFPLCGKSYCRKSLLQDHHRMVHRGEPTVRCTFCHTWFTQKPNLKRHLQKKHPEMFQNMSKEKAQMWLLKIERRERERPAHIVHFTFYFFVYVNKCHLLFC